MMFSEINYHDLHHPLVQIMKNPRLPRRQNSNIGLPSAEGKLKKPIIGYGY